MQSPFIRPLPKSTSVQPPPPPPNTGLTRGMEGSSRADAIRALSSDLGARVARVQHIKMTSDKILKEVKENQQINTSRIAHLARQLNKDF